MSNGHALAEARSLALHRAVAERLLVDPLVLERARERVQGWLRDGSVSRPYAEAWRDVLARSHEEVAAFLCADTQRARDLRQATPFAGALDPRTRWQIWSSVPRPSERA